jgi:hypothetical protein
MFFTTIIVIHKHFHEAMIFRNYFFMVKSICVQPPLLARLATVLVLLFSWRGISCPSSYYPSLGEEYHALQVNFNMFSTTIIEIPKHLQKTMTFENYVFMVKTPFWPASLLFRYHGDERYHSSLGEKSPGLRVTHRKAR